MGNVRMRAEQINYGASNVKVALDDLDPKDLIALSARMDTIEAWKATVKAEEKTGAEVTFTNALALDAVSLSAEIEAEQDLHGLPFPYVGGAYKNKLEYPYVTASSTINGVTFTANSDGTVKANGTATANCNFVLSNKARLDKVASGTYIMNGCPAGGADDGSTYFMGFYAPNKSAYDFGSGANISLSGNEDQSANIYIRIANGYTANNLIFKPMIRLSTESDASFAPYSNICPISGHTSVTITDVDAESQTATVTVQLGQTVYGGSLNVTTGVLTIKTALVTYDETSGFAKFDTVAAGTRYVLYAPVSPIAKVTTNNFADIISNLFKGVTAEPVNLGEIALRASAEPQWLMLVSDKTTIEAFNADIAANNIQVEYPLATPTTIQLTPTQLQMLKGYNRLSSDGGDITVKAYTGAPWGGDEA